MKNILQQIKQHFNIDQWGEGFFDLDTSGYITVCNKNNHQQHRLIDILQQAEAKTPALLQFPDILEQRSLELAKAFSNAIEQYDYQGEYIPAYPIKVNQKVEVVSKLSAMGLANFGLEAGSKAEFIAILAMAQAKDSILICNGYKDQEYLTLAMIASSMGYRVYIIIEKITELTNIIRLTNSMGVMPLLGVRARLSTVDDGKGQSYSGNKAKFGLSTKEIIKLTQELAKAGLLSSLQLMHFHMGTQLANIRNIFQGLQEAVRIYQALYQAKVPLNTINIGGGLAIDYEGTSSRSLNSKNYSMAEYANHVIQSLHAACSQADMPMPNIITESGRAMTAHHAVLIFDVIDLEHNLPREETPNVEPSQHNSVQQLRDLLDNYQQKSPVELYHDSTYWLEQINHLFVMQVINIHEKALAESLYLDILSLVRASLNPELLAHRHIFDKVNLILANKVYGNFSVFRSLPDVWAIDQVFPIVPIADLNCLPKYESVIVDITCDSDGTFNSYVDNGSTSRMITLPDTVKVGSKFAVFLVGAYQDILGDNHNLFGKVNVIDVHFSKKGFTIASAKNGNSVADVLTDVGYNHEQLLARLQLKLKACGLSEEQYSNYYAYLQQAFTKYTYLQES